MKRFLVTKQVSGTTEQVLLANSEEEVRLLAERIPMEWSGGSGNWKEKTKEEVLTIEEYEPKKVKKEST